MNTGEKIEVGMMVIVTSDSAYNRFIGIVTGKNAVDGRWMVSFGCDDLDEISFYEHELKILPA